MQCTAFACIVFQVLYTIAFEMQCTPKCSDFFVVQYYAHCLYSIDTQFSVPLYSVLQYVELCLLCIDLDSQ